MTTTIDKKQIIADAIKYRNDMQLCASPDCVNIILIIPGHDSRKFDEWEQCQNCEKLFCNDCSYKIQDCHDNDCYSTFCADDCYHQHNQAHLNATPYFEQKKQSLETH